MLYLSRTGINEIKYYVSHTAGFTVTPVIVRGAGSGTATWDWGDGSALEVGDSMSHVYATGGPWTVKLTLVNSESYLTGIDVNGDHVVGDFLGAFRHCRALISLVAHTNSGLSTNYSTVDISSWWPSLTTFMIYDTEVFDNDGEWASYDSSTAVFTASMAKREGGVFAAAPICQGNWDGTGTPDVLSFSRGNQIAGNWYQMIDPYQGSLVVDITPEWDGDDALDHYFLAPDGTTFAFGKTAADELQLTVGALTFAVDVSAWVAGTTYSVVARWDAANTLDGTNYVCLSIDDTHSFGDAVTGAVDTPAATIQVGSHGTESADAILEGLMIYRRVLFDGTYGIDVGNGDEIALIAAGADPCEVTRGSWDCPFALPTDSAVGALTTGEGNAWSHPFEDNLIPANGGIGGFMTDGTYGTDGWLDEGTPTVVAALAAAEKMFMGGYKTTSDAVDEGLYQDVVVAAGDDWVVRVICNSDGTSVPRAILWDQSNGAEIGHLDGSNASTRTAPDVLLFTGEAPAGCVLMRLKLVNTQASGVVYWHQVELLDNLITNPSMETGAGNPWIPTGWGNALLDPGNTQASSTGGAIIHSGADCIQLNAGAGDIEAAYYGFALGLGAFVSVGGWYHTSGALRTRVDRISAQRGTLSILIAQTDGASWQHLGAVGRHGAANAYSYIYGVGATFYADDVYAIALDRVSLTCTPASEANSAESSGLRVDGRDKLEQDISDQLTRTKGVLRWASQPRHAPAALVKFVETTNAYLLQAYGDATNYISLYGSAANTITLAFNDGGGEHTTTWDCTGEWSADDEKLWRIDYQAGIMRLWVDGVLEASISTAISFTTILDTIYLARSLAGDNTDAVIKEI